jgi:hypothetical protein
MQHIVDTAGGHLLISTHVGACLAIFGVAHDSIILAEARIRQKLPPGVLGDELGRFKLWCGNVGAHRKGRGSLDYKLREASHIRNQIVELLQSMCLIVKEAVGILKGDRVPWEDFSDSDSDTSEAPNERYPEQQTTTELTQLLRNIAEINTCLMRLAMAIRNPAPHDRFKESAHIDVSYFESFDIDHVRGKFPMAQEYLVLRLGKAISRRRQYLRYREEHRNKYEQGLMLYLHVETADASHPIPQTVAPSEHIESTVASSLPLAIKSSATALELVEDDLYEDTLSQTSYASSAQDSARLRPPPLPSAGQSGEPFECPLCFRFTSVRQLAAWYKHVYRDLQPYVSSQHSILDPYLMLARRVRPKAAKLPIELTNQGTNGFTMNCRCITGGGSALEGVTGPFTQ